MAAVLQYLVNTFNSIGNTAGSVVSSVVTVNYVVGDTLVTIAKSCCNTVVSLLLVIFTATRILLEDLVVFLAEISDSVAAVLHILGQVAEAVTGGLEAAVVRTWLGVVGAVTAVSDGVAAAWLTLHAALRSLAVFCNLFGRSLVLVVSLVPRTALLLATGLWSALLNSGSTARWLLQQGVDGVRRAPPEMFLGLLVGVTSAVLLAKYIVRLIREREVSWEVVVTALLRLLCSTYVLIIRSIARTVGLIFRVVEVTVSNLRVPMFAHAGDSDDEEEDRENLIGDIEDSDEEDREREAQKRRNYDLLLQRRNVRKQERRESTESVEDLLLREVEREREDKLCVICVDKEKCIMILPCRHLCICESCQEPLRTHRNLCPICRKEVKQLIKAYL